MCGIAGVWDRQRHAHPMQLAALPQAMTDSLRHRGPDAGGVWADARPGWRSATAVCRSSICRRPGRSRWFRPAAASSSPTTAKSTMPPSCARARGGGPPLSRPLRYRGDRRGAAVWGVRATAAHRHVRDRAVGPARTRALSRARPAGHQAALLGRSRRPRSLRLGAQGAARRSGTGRPRSTATRSRPICASATCRRR